MLGRRAVNTAWIRIYLWFKMEYNRRKYVVNKICHSQWERDFLHLPGGLIDTIQNWEEIIPCMYLLTYISVAVIQLWIGNDMSESYVQFLVNSYENMIIVWDMNFWVQK